jgi:hypothetical protein
VNTLKLEIEFGEEGALAGLLWFAGVLIKGDLKVEDCKRGVYWKFSGEGFDVSA